MMKWSELLNPRRFEDATGATDASTDPRNEYDRDADRIIFSGAFRRLSRKTQVHPLVANDHVHNRLTHSLETGQLGRTLGEAVYEEIKGEVPDALSATDIGSVTQAACLAHDIGNPPFGHAGEAAMGHWFSENKARFEELKADEQTDLSMFDGNAQGFRVLTQLENHLFNGGLRLTYATLAAFLKYPRTPMSGAEKFSVFLSEKHILDEVADRVGLVEGNGGYARHPLTYLVEAADDICYAVLDLEDAVELKILPFQKVEEIFLKPLGERRRAKITSQFEIEAMFRVNLARMRGPVFDVLRTGAIEGFKKAYERIMTGSYEDDVFSALGESHPATQIVRDAKKTARELVFTDQRKREIELGSFATLDTLLQQFCDAAKSRSKELTNGGKVGSDRRTLLLMGLLGDHAPTRENEPPKDAWTEYQCLRRAVDFVSGMTDRYAVYVAQQIRGMGFAGGQRP